MSDPMLVVLREYGVRAVELDHAEVLKLRAAAGRALAIAPGVDSRTWTIQASSLVGTIVTPALRVLIRPKVSAANLFHLLESGGDPLGIGAEIFDYETSGDLVPAFATFFARHLERALARGVVRAYEPTSEDLMGIRGRVSLRTQLRHGGLPLPVCCEFDEHTADTQLNRVLAAATQRLARFPGVTTPTRRALLQLLALFEETGPLRASDLLRPTMFSRLNAHFRAAERLARMVLERASLTDEHGRTGAGAFLVDMNVLFEKFVEDRLRRYLHGVAEVRPQSPTLLDVEGSVQMRPDLLFRRRGENVYVADAKYKIADDGIGREPDYYQLLAYCTALGLSEGALIYCREESEDAPTQEIVVRGASNQRLVTMGVDLQGTSSELDRHMKMLAEALCSRFAGSSGLGRAGLRGAA